MAATEGEFDPNELGLTPSVLKVPSGQVRKELESFNCTRNPGEEAAEWKLYYWPGLLGRGEYIRLIFAQAGVEWYEPAKKEGLAELMSWVRGTAEDGLPPVFAPPIIRRGDFLLAETCAIMEYLGKKFGMGGETDEEQARMAMLTQSALDYIAQGRLCFHTNPDKTMSYYLQVRETQPHFEYFRTTRMPRFLKCFEKSLAFNNQGAGFFVGSKVSFCDIAMFHALWITSQQCPEAFEACEVPLLKAFMTRIAELPNIKAYLASDRRGKFNGDSFM